MLHFELKPNELMNAFHRSMDRVLGVYDGKPPATTFEPLVRVQEMFNLEIVSEHESKEPELSFEKPSESQKRVAAELLASELALYPPTIIKKTKVERIVICNNMLSNGTDVAGVTQMGPFMIDTLFLDMHKVTRNWRFARHAVHHELFHAIDYVDDMWHYIDTDWFHLNDPDFKYDRCYCEQGVEPTTERGFLSNYSKVAVHEDKAEVYAFLVTDFNNVMKRITHDPILKAKVTRMQELLHKFSDKFNPDFWEMCADLELRNQAKTRAQFEDAVKHEKATQRARRSSK